MYITVQEVHVSDGGGVEILVLPILKHSGTRKKREKRQEQEEARLLLSCLRYARASARSLKQDKRARERQCPARERGKTHERQKDKRACVGSLARSRARLPRVYNGPADHWNHPR